MALGDPLGTAAAPSYCRWRPDEAQVRQGDSAWIALSFPTSLELSKGLPRAFLSKEEHDLAFGGSPRVLETVRPACWLGITRLHVQAVTTLATVA